MYNWSSWRPIKFSWENGDVLEEDIQTEKGERQTRNPDGDEIISFLGLQVSFKLIFLTVRTDQQTHNVGTTSFRRRNDVVPTLCVYWRGFEQGFFFSAESGWGEGYVGWLYPYPVPRTYWLWITVLTLNIGILKTLYLTCPKIWLGPFYSVYCLLMCLRTSGLNGKQCMPWSDAAFFILGLGLNCLLRHVCPVFRVIMVTGTSLFSVSVGIRNAKKWALCHSQTANVWTNLHIGATWSRLSLS